MTGRELRALRRKLGWTQVHLAKRVGVWRNSIARQERGEIGIKESLARFIRLVAEAELRQRTRSKKRGG